MILVTVGTHYEGFERLIKKMDEIADRIEDQIIMQIGHTKYEPQNTVWFRFMTDDQEFNDLFLKADIIIAHSGAGTLLLALKLGKALIVVPRRKKFKEHIDDQQLELAKAINDAGYAISILDVEEIPEAIKSISHKRKNKFEKSSRLVTFLKNYVGEIDL